MDTSATVGFAANAILQGAKGELDAPGLRHLHVDRPEPGVESLGLKPLACGPFVALTTGRGRRRGVRPLQLHDLFEQDGDGPGHPVEAVLGK
jgi:hypothetical protein